MRVIKGKAVLKKKRDTKWPHPPLPAHPQMSRGKLAELHLEDVKAKAATPDEKKTKKKKKAR